MQAIIGVTIGLIALFAVFAVVVSSITEGISGLLHQRSKSLEQGLQHLLDGGGSTDVTGAVLTHPLVQALSKGSVRGTGAPASGAPAATGRPPSYLDAVTFTTALFDTTVAPNLPTVASALRGTQEEIDHLLSQLTSVQPHLGGCLQALWTDAQGDVQGFRHRVEDWYDRQMDRVSGWYGRWAQWWMFGAGLVLAIALNASAVTVANALWADSTLRSDVAAVVAPGPTAAGTAGGSSTPAEPTYAELADTGLPVGWNATAWPGWSPNLLLHALGIVALAVAGSFGAPFWFDLLNRIVNLRLAGPKPLTAAEQRAAGESARSQP